MDDHLPVFGKLDGIADQVQEDLPQPTGITVDGRRHRGIHQAHEFQPLLLGLRLQKVQNVLHGGPKIEVNDFQFQFPRFDFGKVENIINDSQESVGGLLHRFRTLTLILGQVGLQQESCHPHHPIHRGPDFMAHGGQELSLYFQSLQRLITSFDQFLGLIFQRILRRLQCSDLTPDALGNQPG